MVNLVSIRSEESLQPEPALLWDSIWQPQEGYADWVISPIGTLGNSGGLQSTFTLATAVVLCLFTWRIADPGDTPSDDDERYGWWGDAIDLGVDETLLGSKLWQLRRAALTQRTATLAVAYATQSLKVLVDQGACATIHVEAK